MNSERSLSLSELGVAIGQQMRGSNEKIVSLQAALNRAGGQIVDPQNPTRHVDLENSRVIIVYKDESSQVPTPEESLVHAE